ncbi:DsbE family thiol:disulfide interchange protein [Lutimaribacter sp. EGI FJ00015]|uniref:DsbE family thiol:disulfide interchange protein n=1 Tax=Lutimaribacter degradans TaxID=2945989 RepID=A0ACC5ZS61_9RHOB|nr:DsbE family thiol:disulfide interchange protein [Lutimaribacter sp. EGI FJ00013]MCM2560985.1 DsbE family thiol:disulfide interchange protein [Lutimaribacter sp. EGI FJ00013]MCO0612068.1 DsbE family thiol:disulfide interchange protein [Lutimaribacter sp. EGI FJ00015]MCO0634812.1 DsbE family thiol:disulfide interchange protein [Lutimaribacter sp. EGI FJ00014]
MGNLKPMMLAPPLIFAALAVMFYVGMGREDPDQLPTALAGRAAPAVAMTPLEGKPGFGDADLRSGEVVLVNYWASWCAPCRVEHPNLEQLAQQGVTIYGVNYKDKPGNALKFLEELGDPYTAIGADAQGRMALDWGVYGVPETYVIDGNGVIVARHAGPVTQRVMETTLMPAIEAARAGN